ncbi:MAG: hypothetical protein J5666_01160, partial [Bacilli bacterium]|nr:hypothetical protein [Bacilli bacterium]
TYEVYGDGPNGMEAMSQTLPLDYVMSQIGVLEYKQKDFIYDKESRTYKADAFTETIVYENTVLSLVISDAEITIRNGLPYKVEFDFINNQASSDKIHMVTNYSDYGNITVRLPTVNSGGNSGNNGNTGNNDENPLPDVDGEEIPFELFYNEYTVRVTPNYTNVTMTVLVEMGTNNLSFSYTGTKKDGVWTPNDNNSSQIDFNDFIFDDEMMQELRTQINTSGSDTKIYSYSKGGFVLETSEESLDDSGNLQKIYTQVYLNQYFYVTAEYISSDTLYEEITIEWAA